MNSPDNSHEAETVQTALIGIQLPPAEPVPELTHTAHMSSTLTGVQPNPKVLSSDAATLPARPSTTGTLSTLTGVQLSCVDVVDAALLPSRSALKGVLSMPENASLVGENSDKLPDIIANRPDGNSTVTMPNPPANCDPIKTFNVDPLSTEDEMDAIDALLSLQDLCDDTKDDDPVNV